MVRPRPIRFVGVGGGRAGLLVAFAVGVAGPGVEVGSGALVLVGAGVAVLARVGGVGGVVGSVVSVGGTFTAAGVSVGAAVGGPTVG
jgi:hypothetical protein